MALDPRIALGVQPVQMHDPMDQYSKLASLQQAQNQNALAQYQLGAAQRADEQAANRLRLFQEAGGSPEKVANALLMTGDTKGYTEFTKGQAQVGKDQAETIAKHMALSKERLAQVRTPDDYLAWHQENHADPVLAAYFKPMGITAEGQTQKIMQQFQQPGGFETLFKQSALGLDKAMEQTFTSQNLGGTTRVLSTAKYAVPGTTPTAAVVPGSVGQVTMTPGEKAADARAAQRLSFDQAKWKWEKANPDMELKEGQDGQMIAVNKRTGEAKPVTMGGTAVVGSGKPLTESQAKAANFAGRMNSAFGVIDSIESNPSALQKVMSGNSWTNILAPEAAQQYRQAQVNWVTANLRKESGAVIGPDEMEQEIRKYFPVAGDKPKNIEQKRQARLDAMAGMEAEATESGIKAVQKSRQALGARYQRKPAGDDVDTSNPLLK